MKQILPISIHHNLDDQSIPSLFSTGNTDYDELLLQALKPSSISDLLGLG